MKKSIFVIFIALALSSCAKTEKIPDMAFKGTTVEDLVDKPDRELMMLSPPKKYLEPGMTNGQAAVVISNNNLRAGTIERRLEGLQKYVCNLFNQSVGESCTEDK